MLQLDAAYSNSPRELNIEKHKICACQPCMSGVQIFVFHMLVGMHFHLNFLTLIVPVSTVFCLVPMVPSTNKMSLKLQIG